MRFLREKGGVMEDKKCDREDGKSADSTAGKESGFGKKGLLVSLLLSLLLTGICIVFEVLCLKYFKTGFIARHVKALVAISCSLTVIYCLAAIWFAVRGKNTVFRILFSGFLEIDTESIRKRASECGLHPVEERKRDGWVLVRAVKS